ncbi:MAG TPA: hypothetical protein VE621_06570 [Bryobacteraceae bacterium]|nr:hypothetical protein [Bryobacteraceae bacterium]
MSEPVTRVELEAVLSKFASQIDLRMDGLESRFEALDRKVEALDRKVEAVDTKIDTNVEELKARIERVETNLLTAFHQWARSTEIKMRDNTAKVDLFSLQTTGFNERLSFLEERVSEVERQLRTKNPPAA